MQRNAPTPRKSDLLARELEGIIARDPGAPLPPISELARSFGAAYQTMFDAVHILERKGLVVCRRGRRIYPASASAINAPGFGESDCALYRKIRGNILEGIYSAGEAMPKIQFFVKTQRVATHTVTRLLKRLADERLIHKRGKRWIVGKRC